MRGSPSLRGGRACGQSSALRDSEPVYCPIRCVRGKGHTSGPHLCTDACTHVHIVNVLSSTNLRPHGPECSNQEMSKGGGNRIPGMLSEGQGGVWALVSGLEMRCISTNKWGDPYHILSGGPPDWWLACHSQAAALQRPAAAWGSARGARFQDGTAACSGDPWRKEAAKHLPQEQGCACAPPAPRWGRAQTSLLSSYALLHQKLGRNLAKIRFPLQGRELSSHE